MLTFAYPWLFLLAPLPFLVYRFVPPRTNSNIAVRTPFLDRVRQATSGELNTDASDSMHSSLAILAVVWLLVLLALTRPQWLEPPIEKNVPTRDLLLLVDLSGSMDQKDFTSAGGKPITRLEAVKEVLGDFLTRREGDRVGLVVFGNAPFLQVPFTTDLELCRQLLDETAVRMAGPRTALGDAIGLGIHLFDNSEAPMKTIIALTDGNDTASSVPPVEAARVAKDRDITIYTIAMGNPKTVGEEKLDQVSLRSVADETGGSYFLALDRKQLVEVYAELDKVQTRKVKTVSYRPHRDLFFWPLGVALLISLLSHLWMLLVNRRSLAPEKSSMRLQVNPRTFELETVAVSGGKKGAVDVR
ncbi:VWA domain-containing protein [Allorhodopirellula solitaria]|uniref:von Willebrand factor type A domain protein n=1 Tax=Allorhodopirellula solitaria TaxID=2527987 RepID=A0A5C5YCL3_9BACT|nr:VWA domain-containing protein [Allorhodopirellula solitaria]TWT73120.1 von Willebrand factor type A domain protein [Allorhodopirellula solitaria]